MVTRHEMLGWRFQHLTREQRNQIYRHIHARVAKYEGLPGLTSRETASAAIGLARKYGVGTHVILDAYDYVGGRR